jgi:exosortase/archaeosortase family protein
MAFLLLTCSVPISRSSLRFLLLFGGLYVALYYGTYAFIGLSTPGDRYWPFLENLDYVSAYRWALLHAAKILLETMGYAPTVYGKFYLFIGLKSGIQLVYQCLGIGVLSFWTAYVCADFQKGKDSVKSLLAWVLAGWVLITALNILRISLLLLAIHLHWVKPAEIDHHSFYTAVLYAFVALLWWRFLRR